MEALTRLVTESLARHGFDRPLDYRRLHWSRWFRCESPHSLLFVPSKPGVFAVAEEVADFGTTNAHAASNAHLPSTAHVATAASAAPRTLSEAKGSGPLRSLVTDHDLKTPAAERPTPARRRMLAVTQFFEDDDMAYVLDRMLSRENPMRARLLSGRYFVRFVVIDDENQRRSICAALNHWMLDSAEKATGIGSHFATSLELTPATEYIPQPNDAQQSLFAVDHLGDTANREGHDFSPEPALSKRSAPKGAGNAVRNSPALAAEGIARATPHRHRLPTNQASHQPLRI